MLCLMALLAIGQSALATDYYLRGDFNGWGATKLTKDADGWYKSDFYGVNNNETKRFKITESSSSWNPEYWTWEDSPKKGVDGCTTGRQTSGDTGITIKNTSNNGYIQIWFSDVSKKCAYMYTKYSLAGNTLFGSDWAADNTSAVLSWDGTYYTKTYGSQNSGTNIEFKVIRGRSWDDGSFGYDQYKSSSPTNLNGCGSVSNNSGNVKLSLSKKVKSITFKWTAETSIYIILEPDCTTPSISSHPSTSDATYCQNASPTALSVTASGTVDSYQWYSYTNAACTSGETKITGATNSSYEPSTATVGTLYYKCKVTGCNTTKTSNASGAITVKAKPTAYAVSGTASICTGNSTNVTLANSQTGYTYKLYKNSSATSTTKAGTGSALNFSVSKAGTYTVKGYVTGIETCSTDMTNSASVTSIGATITNITPAEAHPYEIVTLTASKSATWSITAPSGVANDEYYPVSGNTGETFSFKGAKGTNGNYTVRASADDCNTDTPISIADDPNKCN